MNPSSLDYRKIVDYEIGELNFAEEVELFQELITSGALWDMREHYVNKGRDFIKRGLCKLPMVNGF